MKTLFKYLNSILCLLTLVSVLSCGKRTDSEYQSKKIQLLLEDIFKKKEYFPAREFVQFVPDGAVMGTKDTFDSIGYFCYLYSSNLKLPDKDLYLHWDNSSVTTYPDSVKLRIRIDTTKIDRVAYAIGVNLKEVNEDTTKLKITLGYKLGGTARSAGSLFRCMFTYAFDKENCKWLLLDKNSPPETPD
jgi:hypothetical protein